MACIKKNTVLFLALYAVFCHVEAFNQCDSDSDCSWWSRPYCCERKYPEDSVCRSSCVGESCDYDSDCAPGESCCDSDGKCAVICRKSCTDRSDCVDGELCCDSDKKCNATCIGNRCTYDGDCSVIGESCCYSDHQCAASCFGTWCRYDGDCATGECCDSDHTCAIGDCYVMKGVAHDWIFAVIVIGVVVFIAVPIAVVVFCCCCAPSTAASRRPNDFYQPCPNQSPPYQPLVTVYPPEASVPPIEMT